MKKYIALISLASLLATFGCAGNHDATRQQLAEKDSEILKLKWELAKKERRQRTTASNTAETDIHQPWKEAAASKTQINQEKPLVAPAILPSPNDVNGLLIIGFSMEAEPCIDNMYERSLIGIAISDPAYAAYATYTHRVLTGQCMMLRRSKYWVGIRVDGVDMVARYEAGIPVSYCTVRDGQHRNLPLTPPGQIREANGQIRYLSEGVTKWVMPPGNHTVQFDLYQPAPTGNCYQYVKTLEKTWSWPHSNDRVGWYQDEPEAYIH